MNIHAFCKYTLFCRQLFTKLFCLHSRYCQYCNVDQGRVDIVSILSVLFLVFIVDIINIEMLINIVSTSCLHCTLFILFHRRPHSNEEGHQVDIVSTLYLFLYDAELIQRFVQQRQSLAVAFNSAFN